MTFEEILDHTLDILQRRGQVSYRALKRQFDLDDAYLDDLKAEIIMSHYLSLIPQRLDGIELRRFAGRIKTEKNPNSPGKGQRQRHRTPGN